MRVNAAITFTNKPSESNCFAVYPELSFLGSCKVFLGWFGLGMGFLAVVVGFQGDAYFWGWIADGRNTVSFCNEGVRFATKVYGF